MFRYLKSAFTALAMAAAIGAATLLASPGGPAAAGGGSCHVAPTGSDLDASGTTVSMRGNCFLPTVLRVEPGAKVHFVNNDSGITHEVAGVAMEWGEDNVGGGMAFDAAFEKPGVYPYACRLHFGMVGAIVVGDGKFAEAATAVRTDPITARQSSQRTGQPQQNPVDPTLARASDSDDGWWSWSYLVGAGAGAAVLGVAFGAGFVARRR